MPEKRISFIMHIIITARYLVTIVIEIKNKISFHFSLLLVIQFWEKLRKYGKKISLKELNALYSL